VFYNKEQESSEITKSHILYFLSQDMNTLFPVELSILFFVTTNTGSSIELKTRLQLYFDNSSFRITKFFKCLIGSVSDVESVIPKITKIFYTKKQIMLFFCYRYIEHKKMIHTFIRA
jgi:hypothetical protein